MNITVETHGQALVFRVSGRVDGSNNHELGAAVADRLNANDSNPDELARVVLDLGGVSYISSAGLRTVLLVAKAQQDGRRGFAVCSLTGPVADVFAISGFDKIIDTHPNLDSALV